jgi:uncharacterized linocin/CFP29 family protein
MNGLAREEAPFSGRIWQEIDRVVCAVRAANCTARRFLEVDGPYGLGLTTVGGDEGWLPPNRLGADPNRWAVPRSPAQPDWAEPSRVPPGTYLVRGSSRPVPLIASEFDLGIRQIEAHEVGCQPLDLCRATAAARDVALEEERLIYYGTGAADQDWLLRIVNVPVPTGPGRTQNTSPVDAITLITSLNDAVAELAARGYAGPFALTVEPALYTLLYTPFIIVAPGTMGSVPGVGTTSSGALAPVLIIELLRNLFRGGVYLAPVVSPAGDPQRRLGAVVTLGSAYSRLIVGQDWVTAYRGRDGVLYRFLLLDSLQLRVCDPLSIQVLTAGPNWPAPPSTAAPSTAAPPAAAPARSRGRRAPRQGT